MEDLWQIVGLVYQILVLVVRLLPTLYVWAGTVLLTFILVLYLWEAAISAWYRYREFLKAP